MIRRPPRSTLFPYRRSSDLGASWTWKAWQGDTLPLDDERAEMLHRDLAGFADHRSEEHTSELQSRLHLVCRLLLEKKKTRPEDNRLTLRASDQDTSGEHEIV